MAENKTDASQAAAKGRRYEVKHASPRRKVISPKGLIIMVVAAMVMAMVLIPLMGCSRSGSSAVQSTMGTTQTPQDQGSQEVVEVVSTTPGPNDVIPGGINSFRDLHNYLLVNPEKQAGFMEFGLSMDRINDLAMLQEAGLNLDVVVPAGSTVTNSGWDGGIYTFSQTFDSPQAALSDENGVPVVKKQCGNPIALSAPASYVYVPGPVYNIINEQEQQQWVIINPPALVPPVPPVQPPVVTPPPPASPPGPVECPGGGGEAPPDTGIDPDPSPPQPPPGVVVPPPGPNEEGPGADPPG